MKLVVGLGNPDKKYANTFHNMGFLAADRLAESLGASVRKKECRALTGECYLAGEKVVIAKPQTYMNLSGESVRELLGRYRAAPSDLLVVYDDLDIPKGSVRVRGSGSSGTHNGMRNIVAEIGSTEFARLRVGIGRAADSPVPLVDYVLSEVRRADRECIEDALDQAAACAEEWCRGAKMEDLMQKYNRKGRVC